MRKIHRWLGLAFSLSALLASGSGVIHSVMTRTQAPPPPARPAGAVAVDRITVSPREALASLAGGGDIQAVNIRMIGGNPWYQILVKGFEKPAYVNATDGRRDDGQDEAYAAQIAANSLGGAEVRKTDYLTSYNAEYLNIFRILPVYRYDVDDGQGTRTYVSTLTGSVTRSTNDKKQLEAKIFSYGHKLMFIPNRNVREAILVTTTGGIFLASLAGIFLFFATRPRRKG